MRPRLLVVLVAAVSVAAVVPVSAPAAAAGEVLFVVAAPSAPTSGESAVRGRLAGAGYTVTLVDDNTVSQEQAAGTAFVLVGQSASSNLANVKSLATVEVPIWVAKPYLFDDFGLTGTAAGTDYADKPGSALTIADTSHPIAAGRSGTVTIQSGGRLSYGRPAASATVVARAGTDASVFTVEPGDTLANGSPAPACRVTFPVYGNAPAAFTADGWAMFEATAAWTAANCTSGPPADTPPEVVITFPSAGSSVSDTVALTATATDDTGVTQVSFAVDDAVVGTDDSTPYSVLWNSGGVADGTHTVTATATDNVGQSGTDTVTFTVANGPPPTGGEVLLVVANPAALTAGENAIRSRLSGSGFTVSAVDDNAVSAAQAAGKSFVLVSQSTNANLATVKSLAGVAVPVWVAKPYLFDDFGLTGRVAGTDYGDKAGSALTISDPGHPLAAGRNGTVTIQSGGRVSYGRPAASAAIVARAGTDASMFTIAPGDALATGASAPACRVTFPVYGKGPATFTADGWALFDATASWAASNCAAEPPPQPGPVERVVFISVDGLNPEAITQLGPAGAPTFYRLMSEGVSTLNARTVFEATQTLPNHTSMVTGRPVSVDGGHRVTFNEDNGSTVHVSAGEYCAGIFDIVHDAGGSTTLYTGKAKFDFLDRSWNMTYGAPDVTGADNGTDKIDTYLRTDETSTTTALIDALSTNPPMLSMMHYPRPDGVGHGQGFMSEPYLAQVTGTDALIGQILDTIAADAELAASTVVVLTSDHGGLGTSHAEPTLAANYTVPFFAWGAGVAAGMDLYALNPDRSDPGTGRPDYTGALGPVRNAEAANLIAELLGFGAIPGSAINTGQSLDLAP
ncbi:MAG: alkaline phosphatase family protein [Actinomycetota bacterium]|nr:alkaline phosphatase family protein [Actinomycetota bacterium]